MTKWGSARCPGVRTRSGNLLESPPSKSRDRPLVSVPWKPSRVLVPHDHSRSQDAACFFFSDLVDEFFPSSRVVYPFQRAIHKQIEFILRVGSRAIEILVSNPRRWILTERFGNFRDGSLLSHRSFSGISPTLNRCLHCKVHGGPIHRTLKADRVLSDREQTHRQGNGRDTE